jgi:hypothetical protein
MFGLFGDSERALAPKMVGQAVVVVRLFMPAFLSDHPEASSALEKLTGSGTPADRLNRLERLLALAQLYNAFKTASFAVMSADGDRGQRAAKRMLSYIREALIAHPRFGEEAFRDLTDLHGVAQAPENQGWSVYGSWVVYQLRKSAGIESANSDDWTSEERLIAESIDRFLVKFSGSSTQ